MTNYTLGSFISTEALKYNANFMALLYNTDGSLVIHNNNLTWMYWENMTTYVQYAQEFNIDTLQFIGNPYEVKPLDANSTENNPHLVLKITDNMYVMFYTKWVGFGGKTIRIAYSSTPNGTFIRDTTFEITHDTTSTWEASIETNGCWSKINETSTNVTGWLGYEHMGYGMTGEFGYHRMGWANITINKSTGHTVYNNRHPSNPLTWLIPENSTTAYGGSNLDSSIRINNKYVLIYWARIGTSTDQVWQALSDDPLFLSGTKKLLYSYGNVSGTPEKYQFYVRNNILYLLYEIAVFPAASATINVTKFNITECLQPSCNFNINII